MTSKPACLARHDAQMAGRRVSSGRVGCRCHPAEPDRHRPRWHLAADPARRLLDSRRPHRRRAGGLRPARQPGARRIAATGAGGMREARPLSRPSAPALRRQGANLRLKADHVICLAQMDVRPSWWKYPPECDRHPQGPGRVIVGLIPCDCPAALPERGHLRVRCRTAGLRLDLVPATARPGRDNFRGRMG